MKKENAVNALIFLGILALDIFTKRAFSEGCVWIFCIDGAFNTGASFGIFDGMTSLFIIAAAMVLVLMACFYKKVSTRIRLAFVFIGAGTLGNLINRVYLGGVIDIFRIWNSSSFNVADVSNLIGGMILLFVVFFDGKSGQKKTFKA